MILRAFSDYLKENPDSGRPIDLLARWLEDRLATCPVNNVDRVIHAEIENFTDTDGIMRFRGKSPSGKILLESLQSFAMSFEQYKFSKWIHGIKASDFNNLK